MKIQSVSAVKCKNAQGSFEVTCVFTKHEWRMLIKRYDAVQDIFNDQEEVEESYGAQVSFTVRVRSKNIRNPDEACKFMQDLVRGSLANQ